MKPKIAIIGKGNVGSALQHGLERAGYEVRSVGKDPSLVRETSKWGDLIILGVPYPAVADAVREIADSISGKTLIDVTNALGPDFQLAIGFSTSGAEELQKKASAASVIKVFNTVFAEQMATGQVKGITLTLFVACDDQNAKEQVLTLGRDIGFDAVDAGPVKNARWL
jgi:predicted dinucleotide-binding enzyme